MTPLLLFWYLVAFAAGLIAIAFAALIGFVLFAAALGAMRISMKVKRREQ